MEEILLTIVIIVAIICYTVYKIDCNHVNKSTGRLSGHRSLEKKPASDELIELLKHKAVENRKDSE